MDSNARRLRGITLLAACVAVWGFWQSEVPPSSVAALRDPKFQVDLNHSPAFELELLPGLGPKRIEEIELYRRHHGPFERSEELDRIPGIGAARMEVLEGAITVDSSPPLPFQADLRDDSDIKDHQEESP